MAGDLKEEIINLMKPLFGDGVANTISNYYEDSKPQEIIDLAHKMLCDFMGENNADVLLEKVLKKFPKLKVNLH